MPFISTPKLQICFKIKELKMTINIAKEIKDFLKSLGKNPNKIAETLKKMKIKGVPDDSQKCPLAKVLKKKFKNRIKEILISDEVEFIYKKELMRFYISKPCQKFISKFDGGDDYPELRERN